MLYDPFLMKKLLKSVICRTYEQCASALFVADLVKRCGWSKKKRKLKTRENIKRNRGHRSKPHLSVIQEKEKKKIIKKKFQTG